MDWPLWASNSAEKRRRAGGTDILRSLEQRSEGDWQTGAQRGEKKGSGRKGMKGNVRERGNGRLDGNGASAKQSERERTEEGGVICLAQMESIFAPFHRSCARVRIKAGHVYSEKATESQRGKTADIFTHWCGGERATREIVPHYKHFHLKLTSVKLTDGPWSLWRKIKRRGKLRVRNWEKRAIRGSMDGAL